MSTFRVNKNVNYTVMSNHHLQDKRLSLKAKGLLSYMLSLPDDWDYSLKGLTTGCRDGIDSVRSAVHELEDGGYLCRSKVRDARGRIIDYNYEVFELPQKERIEKRPAPVPNSPSSENPMSGFPTLENPTQQNTNKQNTKRQSTNLSGQTAETEDFDQMATRVRAEFREKLEIDILAKRYAPEMLQELLDNIVEMYCCPRQTQYVGKQPQTTKAIRLRLAYLKTQRPVLYHQMLFSGSLWPHLQEVQRAASEQLERTIAALADKFPAPDKERSQLFWAAHMNGLKAQAEEVVVREIVYAE